MTDYPLSEEPFPDVQSELPQTKVHTFSLSPVAGHVHLCVGWVVFNLGYTFKAE